MVVCCAVLGVCMCGDVVSGPVVFMREQAEQARIGFGGYVEDGVLGM